MGRKRKFWLGTEVMDHKYGHTEDPMYGQAFQIMAIQLESIDNEFTDWIENGKVRLCGGIEIDFSEYLKGLRKMGENDREWKKMKEMISNDICGDLNTLFGMALKNITPVKDIVAFKIRYLGDPRSKCQIL
jgi:hypothetical protein